MINIANIAQHVLEEIVSKKKARATTVTEEEASIAKQLLCLLDDIVTSDNYEIESDSSLELPDDDDTDTDFKLEEYEDEISFEHTSFSLEYMKKVVEFARPGIAFTTVQHAFPRVKYPMQLARFRTYVEDNGNRRQKFTRIELFLVEKFKQARSKGYPIHDRDIRRWALAQAKVESVDNFVASDKWLLNFKRRNRIRSRKVTRFVSRRAVYDKEEIAKESEEFTNEVKKIIPKYKLESVFNADQSGFRYELVSNRTLSFSNERSTFVAVKSLNATTHSYTIMPLITAAGKLLNPLFLCLQEPLGRFPVTKEVFSASNVVTTCSASGKLTKALVECWIQEVLDDVASNRFLLLVDQWSVQTDPLTYENNLTKGQSCKLLVIPGKVTSTKQPCDRYFFRQWKNLARRMYHHVLLDELNVDLRTRDAIIKMQSLIHNQLSANIFVPMISYSWSACGYIPPQYQSFSNVIDVCFTFDADQCSMDDCDSYPFICCSHCQNVLCFEHFFDSYHFHP